LLVRHDCFQMFVKFSSCKLQDDRHNVTKTKR
jgi:hypothetical protein